MSEIRTWTTHDGGLVSVPADTPLTTFGRFDRRNHALFSDGSSGLIQAITKCGRRAHEIPGHGPVDCPECLELMESLENVTGA